MSINILNSNREEVQDAESLRQLDFLEEVKEKVSDLEKEMGRPPRQGL